MACCSSWFLVDIQSFKLLKVFSVNTSIFHQLVRGKLERSLCSVKFLACPVLSPHTRARTHADASSMGRYVSSTSLPRIVFRLLWQMFLLTTEVKTSIISFPLATLLLIQSFTRCHKGSATLRPFFIAPHTPRGRYSI
jgi:hypothetical protein